ncbi:hypothetical protein F4818DRAFT_435722 [Hypoxylon cercidicola]|nr:hypothetical protein F4818DRAFT_435722 [Hypoxylon cercidicola]
MADQGDSDVPGSQGESEDGSSLLSHSSTGTAQLPFHNEMEEDTTRITIASIMERCSITIRGMKIRQRTTNQETTVGSSLSFTVTLSDLTAAEVAIPATIVDLHGPGGRFGFVHVPGIVYAPDADADADAASFEVVDQAVFVTSPGALRSFALCLFYQQEVPLSLGDGRVGVALPSASGYDRSAALAGMGGPRVYVYSASPRNRHPARPRDPGGAAGIVVRLRVVNRSRFEIDFGLCRFEIRNDEGEVFATLEGYFRVTSGLSLLITWGMATRGVEVEEGKARLVGTGASPGGGWFDDIAKRVDVPLLHVRNLRRQPETQYRLP